MSVDPDELLALYADPTFVDYADIPNIGSRVRDIKISGRRALTLWESYVCEPEPVPYLYTAFDDFAAKDEFRVYRDRAKWAKIFRDDPDAKRRNDLFEKLSCIKFWKIRPLTSEQQAFIDTELALYRRNGNCWAKRPFVACSG